MDLDIISIPIIQYKQKNGKNCEYGYAGSDYKMMQKVGVIVHDAFGRRKTVIEAQVETHEFIMKALEYEVNIAVKDIIEEGDNWS